MLTWTGGDLVMTVLLIILESSALTTGTELTTAEFVLLLATLNGVMYSAETKTTADLDCCLI